jgi:hypothetical protein
MKLFQTAATIAGVALCLSAGPARAGQPYIKFVNTSTGTAYSVRIVLDTLRTVHLAPGQSTTLTLACGDNAIVAADGNYDDPGASVQIIDQSTSTPKDSYLAVWKDVTDNGAPTPFAVPTAKGSSLTLSVSQTFSWFYVVNTSGGC